MIKVLLVDDEQIIRKGMRTFIPWKNLDCTLAGEASDGGEALEMMTEIKADIVITDIRMPGMDGLQLSENLSKDYPDTRVILLTGFDDFEYARKALRFKVVEYLLKPVGEEELTRVLRKTVMEIQKTERENRLLNENLLSLQSKLIEKLIYSSKEEIPSLIPRLKKLQISIENNFEYQVIILFPVTGTFHNPIPDYSYSIPVILEEIKGLLVLLTLPVEKGKNPVYKLLSTIREVKLSAAIGPRVEELTGIPESRKMAETAFSSRRFLSEPSILHSDDIKRIRAKFIQTLPPPARPEELERLVIQEFKSLSPHIDNLGARLLHFCLDKGFSLGDFLRYCRFFYQQAQNEIRNKGFPIDRAQPDPIPNINPLSSWQEILTQINEVFSSLSLTVERFLQKGYSTVTVQAIKYVENHFKDDITLKDISNFTSVSESHISRVFKKDTGINFIPWVNRFRVEYSRELLETTELKLYDIADYSGFSDYKYYSLQFKKFIGITPQKYRKNHFSR